MQEREERVIECVPNFSEGRDEGKIASITEAITSAPGVSVLDVAADPDHNRSVITFTGSPAQIGEGALGAIGRAAELIDLNRHRGAHPRIGAADVVPFVPVSGCGLDACARIAEWVAEQAWLRFQIPTYLYGAAARVPERANLEWIRRGQFEELRKTIETDPQRRPDFGEPRVHPTAGATAVGARKFLLAYNVNLDTQDVELARAIARKIRAAGGGLPCVKALGLRLESRNLAQVSMNLTDFEVTPLPAAFEAVRRESERLGVEVMESEIVGLAPRAAFAGASPESLKLREFTAGKILENRIASVTGRSDERRLSGR